MTPPPLLPGSVVAAHDGFQVEMLTGGVNGHSALLERIRPDVLDIAARSRGWTSAEEIAEFSAVFKIEPLFRVDALALIWRDGRVVGLVGTTYHLGPDDSLVLHLGSLGLLPGVQNRGFLPVLFSLLLDLVGDLPGIAERYRRGRVYLTAVTQSPFIMKLLRRVSTLYPSPGLAAPDEHMVEVAADVMATFEPDVAFDPSSFVLRNEAEFGYRRMPNSTDSLLNELCASTLRYDQGDTFIVVGRVRQTDAERFVRSAARIGGGMFDTLRSALRACPSQGSAQQALASRIHPASTSAATKG
jgi:hypothetical protein